MHSTFDVPVLKMRGIDKHFGGVYALNKVNFEVYTAEVVALIGENGAGKSTLMNILGGIYQPDAGEIWYSDKPITISDVKDSIGLGIAFIHQELNVLDNLDIAGNMFLGREPVFSKYGRLINKQKLYEKAEPYLRRLGLNLSPKTPMKDLSIAQQQIVEIAKALSLNACVLIMDEPTSSLTLSETHILFDIIHQLQNRGVSIIYISHRLNEIEACADRVVGLRDGCNSGELSRNEITHDKMVSLMVGRNIKPVYHEYRKRSAASRFKVERVKTQTWPKHEISFEVFSGEIFGITGLVGAGRTELAQALFGIDTMISGSVHFDGREIEIRSVKDAVRSGLYLIPEDRRNSGLIMEMSVMENLTLPDLQQCSRFGFIKNKHEIRVATKRCQESNIKAADIRNAAKTLSGGNQQKIVLSKWLSFKPQVVILDEPTRGIDVGAKAEIYQTLRKLADTGVIIIVISSDMEEVMNLCHRIMVMHEGKISSILEQAQCTEESLMNLAVGKMAKPVTECHTDK
jgi:ribose transport system ATP-binding protein